MTRFKIIALVWIALIATLVFASCNNNPSPTQNRGEAETDPKEQAEDRNDTKFTQSETERDAQYLVDAYSDGLYEIEAGKQAVQFAGDNQVKDLASSMISAHVNMNDNIKKLAGRKHISVQEGLSESQLEEIKKCKQKKGREYSMAYLDKLIENHKEAITLYEKAAEKSTDPDIRNFFSTSLDELRQHSDMAMNVRDKLKK